MRMPVKTTLLHNLKDASNLKKASCKVSLKRCILKCMNWTAKKGGMICYVLDLC